MSDYTPTTDEARIAWAMQCADERATGPAERILVAIQADAGFDRWLAAERARVWDEGFTRGLTHWPAAVRDASESTATNPYDVTKRDHDEVTG